MADAREKRIAENLQRVRERIRNASIAAGRGENSVLLVGVTKSVDAGEIAVLIRSGCRELGENRPQELVQKAAALAESNVHWHLIGSLQRNKAARTVEVASWIHSIDSMRLAETVGRCAREQNRVLQVLLQVNISAEQAKHGFHPDSVAEQVLQIAALEGLEVRGLMGMGGLNANEAATRRQFATLRTLRDRIAEFLPPGHPFTELSMGMSADFEWAIAEGATMVRIGSLLFE